MVWLTGTLAITALFALRFLVGFAEAPSFPGNARIVASWFPARERGTASAIFNSAQYFATVLFAPLMGAIIYFFGWPWAFVFMGVVGLVAATVWLRMVHEPARHPRLQEQELAYMTAGGAIVQAHEVVNAETSDLTMSAKLGALLKSRTLWGIYLGQFMINALTYFFITWFPVYLIQERGLSVLDAGFSPRRRPSAGLRAAFWAASGRIGCCVAVSARRPPGKFRS